MRNLLRRCSLLVVALLMATALLGSDFSAATGRSRPTDRSSPGPRASPLVRSPAVRRANRPYRRSYRAVPRVRWPYRQRVSRSAVRPEVIPAGDVWARLRHCESGGNYTINTGNGFYGAYQFLPRTWRGLGFPGLPHQASARDAGRGRPQAPGPQRLGPVAGLFPPYRRAADQEPASSGGLRGREAELGSFEEELAPFRQVTLLRFPGRHFVPGHAAVAGDEVGHHPEHCHGEGFVVVVDGGEAVAPSRPRRRTRPPAGVPPACGGARDGRGARPRPTAPAACGRDRRCATRRWPSRRPRRGPAHRVAAPGRSRPALPVGSATYSITCTHSAASKPPSSTGSAAALPVPKVTLGCPSQRGRARASMSGLASTATIEPVWPTSSSSSRT